MIVGSMRIVFDEDCFPAKDWSKGAAGLCTRLQGRYRVLAKPHQDTDELAIVVLCFAAQAQRAHELFDKIIHNCETYGLGRVLTDQRAIHQIETICQT